MSRRSRYHKVSITEVTDIDDDDLPSGVHVTVKRDSSTSSRSTSTAAKKQKDKTFCQYLLSNPFSKGPLLYFMIAAVATLGNCVFYFMDHDSGYIAAGLLGLSVCIFALRHFPTIISLTEKVNAFTELNRKCAREHGKLKNEVGRIEHAHDDLVQTHKRLNRANEKNRENLEHFRGVQDNMKSFGKESFTQLHQLQQRSQVIEKKWRAQLFEHERNVLHTVFERHERQGTKLGMNHEQFQQFGEQLPDEYRVRFERLGTFHKLSGGKSLMQYDDFRITLDVFAEMATDDVDIEFEIKKTPNALGRAHSRRHTRMMSLRSARTRSVSREDSVASGAGILMKEPTKHDRLGSELLNLDIGPVSDFTEQMSLSYDFDNLDNIDDDELEASINWDEMPTGFYDRSLVVTKKTLRSKRWHDDVTLGLFADDDEVTGNITVSDAEEMVTPVTPVNVGRAGDDVPLIRRHFQPGSD